MGAEGAVADVPQATSHVARMPMASCRRDVIRTWSPPRSVSGPFRAMQRGPEGQLVETNDKFLGDIAPVIPCSCADEAAVPAESHGLGRNWLGVCVGTRCRTTQDCVACSKISKDVVKGR